MDAYLTNTITNILHAAFLATYFAGALYSYLKKDTRFTIFIVLLFFALFVIKLLGAYVHYFPESKNAGWVAISLGMILLSYFIIYAIEMPNSVRIIIMCISTFSAFLFLTRPEGFIYIALPNIIAVTLTAFYTRGLTRLGFAMIGTCHVLWIIMRTAASHYVGNTFSPAMHYDNDIYHILLIISTFILYLSILKGDWKLPKTG